MILSYIVYRYYNNLELFSSITEYKMSDGVDNSVDGIPNVDRDYSSPLYQKRKPYIVYQGTPGPLMMEARPSDLPDDDEKISYFNNFQCSTKCCPSPFSCDNGCVCYRSSSLQ